MRAIFLELQKTPITEEDNRLANDYVDYFGVEPEEEHEYADEFVAVCYKYNEETGEHEPRMPDELPFADVEDLPNGFVKYSYGGSAVIKWEKPRNVSTD